VTGSNRRPPGCKPSAPPKAGGALTRMVEPQTDCRELAGQRREIPAVCGRLPGVWALEHGWCPVSFAGRATSRSGPGRLRQRATLRSPPASLSAQPHPRASAATMAPGLLAAAGKASRAPAACPRVHAAPRPRESKRDRGEVQASAATPFRPLDTISSSASAR